jgi:hypothetical protein
MFNTTSSKTALITTILVSFALAPFALAGETAPADSKVGTVVTITGCVHAGRHANQFVLVGVTEKMSDGQISPVPYAIYWLDSTKGLKPLLGEMVDVTGTVTKRESRPGSIKIDVQADEEQSTDVKVERGSQTVTTKEYPGTPDDESSVVLSRPVYRVNVESVKAVDPVHYGPACKQ